MERTIILALATGLGLLCACSSPDTPQEQREDVNKKLDKVEDKMADAPSDADTRQEWEAERNAVLKDLRDLRDQVDRKLGEVNVKLARTDLKPSERTDHVAMKAELEKEKTAIEKLIGDVEDAREDNWNTVRLDMRRATDDLKSWWARFKDDVDRSTDADRDRDGH
jgi:chromosome segregation ATPase